MSKKADIKSSGNLSNDAIIFALNNEFALKLLETVKVIVLVLDTEGRIVSFNPFMEEISGYSLEEVKGKNWFDLFIPEKQRPRIATIFKKAIESIHTKGNVNSILTKEGAEIEIEWYDNTLRDSSGEIIGLVCIGHDITERRKTELAHRKSEALLSNAMKLTRLGCWEYDVASDTFTFNDDFYALFHTTIDKVGSYKLTSEQYAKRFVYPDDISVVAKEVEGVLRSNEPNYSRYLEHRILYDDGNMGYISVQFNAVQDDQGRTIKTFGANQDITEQKRVKQELEEQIKKSNALNEQLTESLENVKKMYAELEIAKKKAEESDRLKSAFLANMSHEIRTPMNGLIGFSNMLNKPKLTDEKRIQYIEIINEMGKQLLNLINDIIDISMIETGQIKIRENKINVNELLLKMFSFYKPVASKNNINLYLKKALPDDLAFISSDATKLRQIIDNLISNALKFIHEGYIEFGYKIAQGELVFYVNDTGIGIAKEMQTTIFERFAQVDMGVSKSYSGTGLGLAISKAYTEKMGGRIWLESEPGKGSTFYVSLPYHESDITLSLDHNNIGGSQQKKPIILIVEDEEINYLFFEELLMNQPYTIIHAKTGFEAITICTEYPKIDLVLMDIKLPDINGMEAMRKIKQIKPDMPVIAQTAYALAGDKEMVLEAGFDDYLSKPIEEQELLTKIKHYITIRTISQVDGNKLKGDRRRGMS